jgi:hypothetical protein
MLQSAEDVGAVPDFNVMAVHVLPGVLQGGTMVIGLPLVGLWVGTTGRRSLVTVGS